MSILFELSKQQGVYLKNKNLEIVFFFQKLTFDRNQHQSILSSDLKVQSLCSIAVEYNNQAGIIQYMQIVSEALFERIKQKPLLYTSTHNRIAFVTHTELFVRQIALEARSESIKIKGGQVISISLENPAFIVILFQSGFLQARKVDDLKQIVIHTCLLLSKDISIKMRVSNESIYVLSKHSIDVVSLSKEKTFRRIYLQETKQQPQDFVTSTIYEEEILILQFMESIAITTEGKVIAEAPFTKINAFKVLKDPVFMGESKEFLLVVQSKKCLKVYDIFDLQQIIEMQLFLQEDENIQLKVDPLFQFVMIRIYETPSNKTRRNSLLKINTDFYKGIATQPFFLFDIQIGLKEDFILFPSHIQPIKGINFHSVDMCFFTKKEIRIASLVIDVSHRTKLNNIKYASNDWKSESGWKDFFFNVKPEQSKKEQKKQSSIQFSEEQNYEQQWEKFISKFYQQNLQKFKCQNYKFNQNSQPRKCIENSSKHYKDNQNQDALNTLSGSSSFGSLKQLASELPFLKFRLSEGENYSEQSEAKDKVSFALESKSSGQSQDSQRDVYFKHIETNILSKFDHIQQKICTLGDKMERINQVHIRKLKNINSNVKKHVKQTESIGKNIQKWCKEEFDIFGKEVKDQLKDFSSILGRLQIMQIRNVKKLKKHYRDFLQVQLQQCAEKLQQSQKTIQGIERILKKQQIQ